MRLKLALRVTVPRLYWKMPRNAQVLKYSLRIFEELSEPRWSVSARHRINTWQTCTSLPHPHGLHYYSGCMTFTGGWRVATFGKDLDSNLDFLIYWSLGLRPNWSVWVPQRTVFNFPRCCSLEHNTGATGWDLKPLTGHRGNATGAWQLPPGAGSSAVASQSNQPRLVQVTKGKKKNPAEQFRPSH